ncbi:MAG: SufS family cysteine desulfurase [Planctomycetota bacterium]|nr:MAG: SufS family cysteine desulfurase [Planctomycetota bacterium]
MFPIDTIRAQFPILSRPLPKGVRLAFLDTAASAQKPQCVIDKEREVYETCYANAYRGVYRFGAIVDEQMEATRSRIAQFIGADSSEEIIFTSGATMSLNLVAMTWARAFVNSGDEILLSEMEHHANLVPWQLVAKERGAVLKFIPLTADGQLDMAQLDGCLTSRCKLVAVTGMSNMLGTINPVAELAQRAHAVGAILVVDGAQSVPHLPVNVQAEGIDFLAFSGHKIYGPSGVGVLYGRRELLEAMPPFLGGGHMIDRVFKTHSTWSAPPAKFEAGTPAIAQVIALGAALEWIESVGLVAAHTYEQGLTQRAWDALMAIPGMVIHGPPPARRGGILSFTVKGAHPEDLAQLLDRKGVFVRHGHHCTMPLHDKLGLSATVRASFGVYSNDEDIHQLVEAIEFARGKLRLV